MTTVQSPARPEVVELLGAVYDPFAAAKKAVADLPKPAHGAGPMDIQAYEAARRMALYSIIDELHRTNIRLIARHEIGDAGRTFCKMSSCSMSSVMVGKVTIYRAAFPVGLGFGLFPDAAGLFLIEQLPEKPALVHSASLSTRELHILTHDKMWGKFIGEDDTVIGEANYRRFVRLLTDETIGL